MALLIIDWVKVADGYKERMQPSKFYSQGGLAPVSRKKSLS